MHTTPDNPSPQLIAADSSPHASELPTEWLERRSQRIAAILLALLPLGSFLAQYALSLRAGTQQVLFHHLTVTVVDWIFLPFNFFVVRVIEWRSGGRLYVILCISVMLNLLTHAFWQYNGLDPGHMITRTEVVLPAGWVHLAFSILETVLLLAFVFCRKVSASKLGVVTMLATAYFMAMGICGYVIHNSFIISDVVVLVCGLFSVLVYPSLVGQKSRSR